MFEVTSINSELEFNVLPIKMKTWSIYLFLCVLTCCAILLSESTKKLKRRHLRAAKKLASTGPCNPNNTCANRKDVCQLSDGNCYPKSTPGLNDDDDCKDIHPPNRKSECPGIRYLCNNRLYYPLMTSQCPHTCKRCKNSSQSKQKKKKIKSIEDQLKKANKKSKRRP